MKIFIIIFAVFVSACSGMTVNTNLGSFAKNKVKSVIVEEYSLSEISKYDAVSLGFVESSYCQERLDEPKPSKAALVSDLKVRTHSLGGNGVVLEACGKTAYDMCHEYMECRGVAYSVPPRQSRP